MYTGYAELTALSPRTYLEWELFETPYDTFDANVRSELARRQYEEGLRVGREFGHVHISANGTWGASTDTRSLQSCEGIGYHACTKDLLHGLLDSGAEFVVYRYRQAGVRIR